MVDCSRYSHFYCKDVFRLIQVKKDDVFEHKLSEATCTGFVGSINSVSSASHHRPLYSKRP